MLILNSLLVLPAASSRNVAKNLKQYHLLSVLFALSSGIIGLTASYYLGASAGAAFGAALGIIALFCGVTNGALASMMLSVELFGAEYLPLFGIAVAVSYALSGHISLYHTQHFEEPKMGHRDREPDWAAGMSD